MVRRSLLCLLIATSILGGCGPGANNPGRLEAGTVLTSFQDYNIVFYNNISVARNVIFELISRNGLEGAELHIDIKTPYQFYLEPMAVEEELPYYVYQNYQDIDWDKMYRLYQAAEFDLDQSGRIDEEAVKEFTRYRDLYCEAFQKYLKKDPYRDYYHYTGSIVFDMTGQEDTEHFEEVTLITDTGSFNFNIGRIVLDYNTAALELGPALLPDYLGAWDKQIIPDPRGTIIMSRETVLSVEKDLCITGFRLLNPDVEIAELSYSVEKEGVSLNKKYKPGDRLELDKGSKFELHIMLNDRTFMNKHLYSTCIYAVIDYVVEGLEYSAVCEASYRTRHCFHELYASLHDNVDFLPYYYQYYQKVTPE
jgi:hypothetical protein